ncbi:MAG: DNA repair protein RadC [Clostridiales bacterium]|jgi:DNA repair protein RadC|nr:DNA repair protein RadC [Clostridiales bacterium]
MKGSSAMSEGHRQRLRQRYIANGIESFQDHEALELLLTYAIPRRDTNDIAHALLGRFGSLTNVLHADVGELTHIDGVGESVAVYLRLHGQLVSRVMREGLQKKTKLQLNTPIAAASYAISLVDDKHYECVYVLSLDKNIRLLHAELLFTGTISEAPLYPRRVVENALLHRASAVMLVHNHPSGDPRPSGSDIQATQTVKKALNAIDIGLHDHLIVGQGVVYSMLRELEIDSLWQEDEAPVRAHRSPPPDDGKRVSPAAQSGVE